jgi:serine/threonine protein kinase
VCRFARAENVMINPATGAVKLGDFGLVRALDGSSGARGFGGFGAGSNGNGGSFSPLASQRRGLPRSNSFPRVAMNGGAGAAGAAAAAPKATRVGITANVATGAGASLLSLPQRALPPQPAQPAGGSRLTRRLTPLILGPPPPPVPVLSADDAWPPPAPLLATSPAAAAAPRPRLRRQMTPQTGSLVTMAPEVWAAAPEYGTAADVYSLVRAHADNEHALVRCGCLHHA